MVVLYEHPLSPYAQKVKIALGEKGVAVRVAPARLLGGDLDEFARAESAPRGAGAGRRRRRGLRLDHHPRVPRGPLADAAAAARGAAERARVRMLEELCDTYYEAINWAVFEIRVFQRATGELAERLEARAAAQRAGVQRASSSAQLGGRP